MRDRSGPLAAYRQIGNVAAHSVKVIRSIAEISDSLSAISGALALVGVTMSTPHGLPVLLLGVAAVAVLWVVNAVRARRERCGVCRSLLEQAQGQDVVSSKDEQ
jgi:hypothetical protein